MFLYKWRPGIYIWIFNFFLFQIKLKAFFEINVNIFLNVNF